jgi:hypothetical protein
MNQLNFRKRTTSRLSEAKRNPTRSRRKLGFATLYPTYSFSQDTYNAGNAQSLDDDTQSLVGDSSTSTDDTQSLDDDTQTFTGDAQSMNDDVQSMNGDAQTFASDAQSLDDDTQTFTGDAQSIANDPLEYR